MSRSLRENTLAASYDICNFFGAVIYYGFTHYNER